MGPSEPYGSVGGMLLGSADILYKVFRPCFGLISGISNTGLGCRGVASGISFLRFVCICALIVVQPHSPLQDRKKRRTFGDSRRIVHP